MLVAKIFRLDRKIYLKWDRGTLLVTKGTSPREILWTERKERAGPF